MRDEMKKVPRLRFRGFSEDWELCKLSGVIEKLSGGASIKPTDYLEDGIRTIPKGAVNATGIADLSGSKYISEDFFEKNITSHVHTNNLVTSLRDLVPSAPNMGRIVRIEGDEEQFLMPQGVYKLELFEGMDGDFLISFSNSDKYRKIISAEKNGSTQVHIRNGEFLNIDINLPSKYEQKKIGAFFKQLDDTITLHQRKLDQLKELKKAYLQLMFPKKDETVPRVRFADFEDDWQLCKLGETFSIIMGQSPNSENYTENPDDYILVQGNSDMKNNKVVPRIWTTQVTKKAEKGDLILSVRAPVGEIGKTDYNVVLGRGVAAVKGNDFIFQQLRKMKDSGYWTRYSTGSTFESINSNDIKEALINIPNKDEQQKIGDLITHLDDAIILNQNKLNQLKSLKKSYLQNMFI